jgi:hypothetical protein
MAKLDDLPVELLAHVALFTNKGDIDVRELLALRCASRSCKDAVRRAAKQHRAVVSFTFQGSSAQKIEALGRVFGSGCLSLTFGSVQSDEVRKSLQNFVTSTNGELRFLFYSGVESSPYFSTPALLELCRACPLLKTLIVHGSSSSIITAANLDDFASAVGSACPLLEYVRLPHQRSMAEDYQWHFPRFKCISFYRCGDFSAICWDKIELTLRTCVHATEVDLSAQTVSPRLVDLILAAPGAGRIKGLDFNEATISPELILRLAGGLEALSDLQFPHNFDAGRAFYSSLVRARPSIAKFSLGFCNKLDDDALRIVCHGLRLERLELTYAQNLTDRAIDIILESPCADTLRSIDIGYDHQFSSEDVLRLVRGCPELAQLEWENDDLDRDVDGANVDAVDALLVSRGGRASGAAYW